METEARYSTVGRPAGIPDWVVPGAQIAWDTWSGTGTAKVERVDLRGIWTNKPGIYWEATCFHTVAEAISNTRGFRPAQEGTT